MPTESDDVVNISEAKTHLSSLAPRAWRGERMVIPHAGKPVAQLEPLKLAPRRRRPGRDQIVIADDFDAPLRGFEP